jgi:hypothetical protein
MDDIRHSIPLFYLSPIGVYSLLINDSGVFSDQGAFSRKSFLHRGFIGTHSGIQELIIPLCKHDRAASFKSIRISNAEKWQKNHWRSIKTAYNSSPFFEYYQEEFEIHYRKKYTYLSDFNRSINRMIFHCLGMNFQVSESPFDNTLLFRGLWEMESPSYHQVFEQENGFISDLSILDLLFNLGPESRIYLQKIWPLPQDRITTFDT